MSYNFSANQFNSSFEPSSRIRNYEKDSWFARYPLTLKGHSEIIANDLGRQLPHISKPDPNPWGYFKNTWQLPRKITKEVVAELNLPQANVIARWERHIKYAEHRALKDKKLKKPHLFPPEKKPERIPYAEPKIINRCPVHNKRLENTVTNVLDSNTC